MNCMGVFCGHVTVDLTPDDFLCCCGHTWIDHESREYTDQDGHPAEHRPCVAIVLPTMYTPYPEPAEYCHCGDFHQ